jgi:capsular polysaccharide transport system permease protein
MFSPSRIVMFLLVFLLPFMAVVTYEVRFATDRYASESAIIITAEHGAVPSLDLSAIGLSSPATHDPLILQQFIESTDMLQYLDKRLDLRGHYSDAAIDWWSRLPAGYSLEDFHTYVQNYMKVTIDTDSQVITLHVEAFNREYAQKVVKAIIERSQEFTDRLNDKVSAGQTKFFEDQLVKTEDRLKSLKTQLLDFQSQHRMMTTESEAQMVTGNIAELERALLKQQGELETKLQVLSETSPAVQILRKEIATLQAQIDQEKNRLTGGSSSAVNELDAQFREIQFNIEFVTTLYKSNLAQLEAARASTVQRLKYLVVVTQPSIADASLYPNRGFIIGTAAMILFMIFFVVSLIVAIIREHV